MASPAVEITGLLVTITACAVTVVATVINYYVLKVSLEPEVVAFPEHDEKRPTLIMLVLKNVGKGSAYSVRFYPERPVPSRAWGIEEPSKAAKPFESGPLVAGIPFFPPGAQRIIDWGQFGGLRDALKGELRVSIQYYARTPFGGVRLITSESVLDVESFSATSAAKRHEVEIKSKALEEISRTIQSLASGASVVRVTTDKNEE